MTKRVAKDHHLDLRSPPPGDATPDSKRFDLFLIDTVWNRPVSRAVHHQLPLIYEFQSQDTLYILTREQSVAIGKANPDFIGHDPTLLVYDRFASSKSCTYKGFRLNLGLMRNPEQALKRLQEFVRFIAQHRAAENLDQEIRRQMHREGLQGVIQIVREGFEAGVELV